MIQDLDLVGGKSSLQYSVSVNQSIIPVEKPPSPASSS
jgi:hypothetical protein